MPSWTRLYCTYSIREKRPTREQLYIYNLPIQLIENTCLILVCFLSQPNLDIPVCPTIQLSCFPLTIVTKSSWQRQFLFFPDHQIDYLTLNTASNLASESNNGNSTLCFPAVFCAETLIPTDFSLYKKLRCFHSQLSVIWGLLVYAQCLLCSINDVCWWRTPAANMHLIRPINTEMMYLCTIQSNTRFYLRGVDDGFAEYSERTWF